jgi:hypothetical protein
MKLPGYSVLSSTFNTPWRRCSIFKIGVLEAPLPQIRQRDFPAQEKMGLGVNATSCLPRVFGYVPPAVAQSLHRKFPHRTQDNRRPSKFIVLADNMRAAINMAGERGGADFQSRFDKSTAQAEQMKEGALRVL